MQMLSMKRIPFMAPHDFDWLTVVVLHHAWQNQDNVFGALLMLLSECRHTRDRSGLEQVGASYRTLERIVCEVGLDEEQLTEWILLAESIPLAERHGEHILEKLERQEVAALIREGVVPALSK